ncbi:MAG: carboxypeptidase-like regulatory domain-containing protein [Pyrinomonadaceae bacterium]
MNLANTRKNEKRRLYFKILKSGGTFNPTAGSTSISLTGATANFTFHVGTSGGTDNGYTPVALANISAVSAGDGLTVRAVDTVSPASISTPKITRYWELTETRSLTADLTFTYLDADDNSITDPTALRVFRNAVNVCSSDCVTEGAFTGTVTGITEFSPWTIAQQAPTAASVTVGGRVLTIAGRGIANARISMTDVNGEIRLARTNPFGYYRFANVSPGATYVFSAAHKRFEFAPQVIIVTQELADFDFVASPPVEREETQP